jgi:carbon storage regulator
MLVLSRKAGDGIVLPGLGITVRVLSTKGNTVRIGIEAPDDVQIVREELLKLPLPAGTQALRLCPV